MKWILVLFAIISFNSNADKQSDAERKALNEIFSGNHKISDSDKELDRLGNKLKKGASKFLSKSGYRKNCTIDLKLVNGRYKGEAISGFKSTCYKAKFYFENLELENDILNNPKMKNITLIISGDDPIKNKSYIK